MARTRGPMMSEAASGTLANLLNFSTNKGRAYVRKKPNPIDPGTATQLSSREAMRWLSERWSLLTSQQKEPWESAAQNFHISGFNLWQKINLERWGNLLNPTLLYNQAPSTPPTGPTTFAFSPGPGQATIAPFSTPGGNNWLYGCFASMDNGFTPTRENHVGWLMRVGTNDQELTLSGLTPGVWYFRCNYTRTDGTQGPFGAQANTTVS